MNNIDYPKLFDYYNPEIDEEFKTIEEKSQIIFQDKKLMRFYMGKVAGKFHRRKEQVFDTLQDLQEFYWSKDLDKFCKAMSDVQAHLTEMFASRALCVAQLGSKIEDKSQIK